MQKDKFTLIVSLPKNSVKLAKAAEEGGADFLKIHLNVLHRASKTKFGSFLEEKNRIKKILNDVKIPVGIMPGEKVVASFSEMMELEQMGIYFFDIYIQNCPATFLKLKMKKIFAVDYSFNLGYIYFLNKLGMDALEASIIQPLEYGKNLSIDDLTKYKLLASLCKKDVIVPTQRKILPEEIPLLKKIGVSGIMIGAIVTGTDVESIKDATTKFRNAIDEI